MSFETKINRLAHLWGLSSLALFVCGALVLTAMAIIEKNYTLRTIVVIFAFAGIGVLGYGLVRFFGYILIKVMGKD
jgi:hypothetical protein